MDLPSLDLGLLLVRLALAFVFFAHATQKLMGWFSGTGLAASAATFERLGQRPGTQMVLVAVAAELASSLLLVLGVAWPLAVAVGAATMLVAGTSLTLKSGTAWNAAGGGEYPYVIATTLLCLGFVGPGGWSLDAALQLAWNEPTEHALSGVGALVLAGLAAVGPILRTRHNLGSAGAQQREDGRDAVRCRRDGRHRSHLDRRQR